MARYRFIEADNKVICLSTFAKKSVKGIAKCSPNDTFNLETGRKLAQLRCDFKVANKRADRAADQFVEALELLRLAWDYYNDSKEYYENSEKKCGDALADLTAFEATLKNK